MVDHYSTFTLNESYIQSKSDTAIEHLISQPLKKIGQSNKLKHVDLKDYLKSKGIYHPDVVTKYVYNHKDNLNYEIHPNHQKTQEFLSLPDQTDIMNELQYLDEKYNIDHINTDDWNIKYNINYSDIEKLNDNQENLDTRKHLNEVVDLITNADPITKPDFMILTKYELIDVLDYKNINMLNTNLNNFNKNEVLDEFDESSSVAALKLAYFPKQILKSKNIEKRDDDTLDEDLLHKDEKYKYIFQQELHRKAENSDRPSYEEISIESGYTTELKYTLNKKNEPGAFITSANIYNKKALATTLRFRMQEQFGSLMTKMIRQITSRPQNSAGT